jgi:DNA-binding NarL/FixJ family response regulator
MPVAQILIVEDFMPWWHLVQEMLKSETDLKIIATAANASEAVQKVVDLQPDIILMDLDLLEANGFEATRQICVLSPASKILFVSERRGSDFVEAAFQAGGLGYVLKSDLYCDLLTGIRVILRGQQFVSRGLIDWREVSDKKDISPI